MPAMRRGAARRPTWRERQQREARALEHRGSGRLGHNCADRRYDVRGYRVSLYSGDGHATRAGAIAALCLCMFPESAGTRNFACHEYAECCRCAITSAGQRWVTCGSKIFFCGCGTGAPRPERRTIRLRKSRTKGKSPGSARPCHRPTARAPHWTARTGRRVL
eukprot:6244118-Prymnesium_polylepis.1